MAKRNLNELAKELAYEEGLNEQVSIAQIKELLKLVSIKMVEDIGVVEALIANGRKHLED